MTRGQMACATLALLIRGPLVCAPLPDWLLTATPTHPVQRPKRGRSQSQSHQRALDSALVRFEGVPLRHSDPLGRSYTGAATVGCSESRSY